MLVERDVENVGFGGKDALCPVAVVHIPVDNGDSLTGPRQLGRSHCHVFQQTEAHRPIVGDPVLQIGVPREIAIGERRVALIPESVEGVVASGSEVTIERGAGVEAGFLDEAYENAGARIADSAAQLLGGSDLVLKVQPPRVRESLGYPTARPS